jgi:hypothetical protein
MRRPFTMLASAIQDRRQRQSPVSVQLGFAFEWIN